MSDMQSPLFHLLSQINRAAENGFDLVAVSMAVALPDICVSLMSDDGLSDGVRYKGWCSENLNNEFFSYVTADDLYSIRCGVLHNGRFGDLKHNVSRVIFVPASIPGSFSNMKADDAYIYSTVEFCRQVNRAVVAWYEANHQHPNIVANIDRLMQYRPGGVPPYIVGGTVVA